MKYISNNEKETAKIAANFVKTTLAKADFKDKATVVGLYGELGSGKTTFMKYVAKALEVKESIVSPTFVIMKKFGISPLSSKLLALSFSNLFHIDAYRIEKDLEMLNLGWQETITDPDNLIFIEWPEKIANIMPSHIMVRFEHIDKDSRRVTIEI